MPGGINVKQADSFMSFGSSLPQAGHQDMVRQFVAIGQDAQVVVARIGELHYKSYRNAVANSMRCYFTAFTDSIFSKVKGASTVA